ncbi:MAG TPA: hypothetical protein VD737_00980 [Steroidobacteraceae bacterium]|nr:hypothetical protein [Steroidobacteraceae bacterium]
MPPTCAILHPLPARWLQEAAMTGTEYWALGYLSGMLMAWLMRKTERPPRANR